VRELLERHRPHPWESDLRHFEWHYLNRLCHQELLTLDGRAPAEHFAYSPDGKRLASTHYGEKGGVRVWDAQTGRELLALEGQVGLSAVISPDGKRLASEHDQTVKLWDAQTGQELFTCKGHT
jgi:WD40 repeat protein